MSMKKPRFDYYRKMINAGIMTVNQARKAMELPPFNDTTRPTDKKED